MVNSLTQILHITRSGMLTHMLDLDVVSHNLANVGTTGFKAHRSNFQELLNETNGQYGGIQLRASQMMLEQGALHTTGNSLDLAISGQGFFAVQLDAERVAYTRDGQFALDANRLIVNAEGLPLVWEGEVPEDASDIAVFPDGTVMALQGDQWNQIGTIQLYRFANPHGLQGYGGNLWLQSETSGEVEAGTPGQQSDAGGAFGQIVGRALEQSNVNVANEMTQMVTLQRSFEMSLRTFQQTDTMLAQAIHMRRG